MCDGNVGQGQSAQCLQKGEFYLEEALPAHIPRLCHGGFGCDAGPDDGGGVLSLVWGVDDGDQGESEL